MKTTNAKAEHMEVHDLIERLIQFNISTVILNSGMRISVFVKGTRSNCTSSTHDGDFSQIHCYLPKDCLGIDELSKFYCSKDRTYRLREEDLNAFFQKNGGIDLEQTFYPQCSKNLRWFGPNLIDYGVLFAEWTSFAYLLNMDLADEFVWGDDCILLLQKTALSRLFFILFYF